MLEDNLDFLISFMFLLGCAMLSKVFGLQLFVNKDILVIFFYSQLVRLFTPLDFIWEKIIASLISFYSSSFTTFLLGGDCSR